MFRDIVQEGNAFFSDETVSRNVALELFLSNDVVSYVAIEDDNVVGAYLIKPNYHCRGSHVANATYMVAKEHRRHGIGRMMAEHSLQAAKDMGYRAMQFNAVVSTNTASIALWKSIGFSIVGTVPDGFHDPNNGFVDLYVMHKLL